MRHIDGSHTERALQPAQLDPCFHPELSVEVRQRLIEQKQAWLAHDRACERAALLLPARQLAGAACQQMIDGDFGGSIVHRALDLVARRADHLQREADIFGHRHVRIQRVTLKHHRNIALAGLGRRDIDAVEEHSAGVGRLEAGQNAQRRRLARARRAEQSEKLAMPDRQIDAVQRGERPVPLDDAFEANVAAHRRPPPLTAPTVKPLTMCRCAINPRMITGAIANIAPAASRAH